MSYDRNNVTFKNQSVDTQTDRPYSFGDKCVLLACACAGAFVLVLELLGKLENI